MDLESKAISTESIVAKLRNLKEYMPNEDGTFYKYANYIADRIGRQGSLVPQGFKMTIELALYDLSTGIDGFTGKPIQSGLVGYPPQIYAFFGSRTCDLAKATCPEDFSHGVWEFEQKVNAELRKKV